MIVSALVIIVGTRRRSAGPLLPRGLSVAVIAVAALRNAAAAVPTWVRVTVGVGGSLRWFWLCSVSVGVRRSGGREPGQSRHLEAGKPRPGSGRHLSLFERQRIASCHDRGAGTVRSRVGSAGRRRLCLASSAGTRVSGITGTSR